MNPEDFEDLMKVGKQFNEQVDNFHSQWRTWLHNNPCIRDLSISIGIHGFIELIHECNDIDGDDGTGSMIAMAMFCTYSLQRMHIGSEHSMKLFGFNMEDAELSPDASAPELFYAILQQMLESSQDKS